MEDFKSSLEFYLNSGGVSCPFCGSPEIEGGFINISEGGALQSIICLDCEAEWDDLYKLTDVVNINVAATAGKEAAIDG